MMLPLVVVDHPDNPTLLGRSWLQHLRLEWNQINAVHSDSDWTALCRKGVHLRLDLLLRKHSTLFHEGYECMTGYEAHIQVRPDARPVFCKPRRIPYAFKDEVERVGQT